MANIPLNPMRTFTVAARHATLTEAARKLGVTQVAVSVRLPCLKGSWTPSSSNVMPMRPG